jgi:hypothetical protein
MLAALVAQITGARASLFTNGNHQLSWHIKCSCQLLSSGLPSGVKNPDFGTRISPAWASDILRRQQYLSVMALLRLN